MNAYRSRPFSHTAAPVATKKAAPAATPPSASADPALWEALRAWRQTAAAAAGLPAYCIFTNAALDTICEQRPAEEAQLLAVKGVGPTKVASYGASVLAIIRAAGPAPLLSRKRSFDSPAAFGGGGGGGGGTAAAASGRVLPDFMKASTKRAAYSAPPPPSTSSHSASASSYVATNGGGGGGAAAAAKPANISSATLTAEQKGVADRVLAGENVFLTGAAGTGKSYLFAYLLQELTALHGAGTVAVTAPTGVAAVNVNGVTIHSFSGVGLGKGSLDSLLAKVSRNGKASDNWRKTKVLLVDEISMLDGELFSKLAEISARVRGIATPFGGIQLVLCGDFFQLPPVGLGRGGT